MITLRALLLIMVSLAGALVPTRGADKAGLPDPLVFNDGTPVKTEYDWTQLLKFLVQHYTQTGGLPAWTGE